MMVFALNLTNMLSWIFIVLAYWNNSMQVDMSFYWHTLSWFRGKQYCRYALMLHASENFIVNGQVKMKVIIEAWNCLKQVHKCTCFVLWSIKVCILNQNKMNCELMLTYDTPALRQTGSRNLTGQTTLPTIWGTYIKLVTKYQISAINSCWEKCD